MEFDDDVRSPVLGRRLILRRAGTLGLMGLTLGCTLSARGLADVSDEGIDVSDLLDDPRFQGMCILTPSETAGPFYFDLGLYRSDITEGLPGIKTRLTVHVVRASDCTPVANADVDVWHCDAIGRYSGVAQQGTAGMTFLRGIQTTDVNGTTYFDTIYPGWYPGRTTHIHFKVRPNATSELTSQMYFSDSLNTRVAGRPPYSSHGVNPTTNASDGLYLPETLVSVLGVSAGKLQIELTIGIA
jgi:protocatechuate 3,4-dioxygenase beta subunit